MDTYKGANSYIFNCLNAINLFTQFCLIFCLHRITNRLQLSDKSKDEKEDEIKPNEAAEAMNAMKHVTDLVVQMDESLKEEEDILNERASRLRRQSADAFKLIDDVKKLQK